MGAKIDEEGSVCVPARTLIDLVSSLKQGNVDIQSDKEKISIKAGGYGQIFPGHWWMNFPRPRLCQEPKKSISIRRPC